MIRHMDQVVLGVPQVQAILQCGKDAARAAIRESGRKVGKRLLTTEAALRVWLEKRQSSTE